MRIFLLLAFILISAPAFADAPVTPQMANTYYESCRVQPQFGQLMSEQTQDLMCACTAAKMLDNMTIDDVKNMSLNSDAGRIALNKVVVQVYAPCIEYPAKDYYMNTCIQNPETKKLSAEPWQLCDCMSTEVAGYLKTNSQTVFEELLDRNPNMTDPMTTLTDDPQFQQFAQAKLLSCFSKNR